MNDNKRLFEPAGLAQCLQKTSLSALQNGALQSIATERMTLSGSVPYEVRKLSSLRKKPNRQTPAPLRTNPFLPYEEDLYICHLPSGHVILLNKFNVVDNHLLVVTDDFEAQELLLEQKEFQAMNAVMASFPMLAFYNSGIEAGASQPHRHFQALPLQDLPIDVHMKSVGVHTTRVSSLPFPNLAVSIADKSEEQIYNDYLSMMEQLGLCHADRKQPLPYNLLMTSQWLMIIPRAQDRYEGISINALGFAGLILVKNDQQLDVVKSLGGDRLLREVCP